MGGALNSGHVIRGGLTDAAAVIVPFPPHRAGESGEGMSLGGVWTTYGYGPGTPDEELGRAFVLGFTALVAEAAEDMVSTAASRGLEARRYEVGPAAGGLPELVVRVLEDARPVLEDGALLWAIGQAAHACLRRFRGLIDRLDVRYWGNETPLRFTEPMLLGLCYAHVRDTYHPRAVIEMESHVRVPSEFSSPAHPTGGERYLVRARIGRRSYFYSLDSHATVTEHFLRTGRGNGAGHRDGRRRPGGV